MKIDFEWAVERILEREGGYVNDPDDDGGETNWGISKRAYPSLNIKSLTKEAAKEIYRRDYWNAVQAEKLPEQLRLAVFDMAVNAGVGRAIMILERCCGYPATGKLSPKILAATPYIGLFFYQGMRKMYYESLNRKKFLNGWIKRVDIITGETINRLKEQ